MIVCPPCVPLFGGAALAASKKHRYLSQSQQISYVLRVEYVPERQERKIERSKIPLLVVVGGLSRVRWFVRWWPNTAEDDLYYNYSVFPNVAI